jgi:hypothetical protein
MTPHSTERLPFLGFCLEMTPLNRKYVPNMLTLVEGKLVMWDNTKLQLFGFEQSSAKDASRSARAKPKQKLDTAKSGSRPARAKPKQNPSAST